MKEVEEIEGGNGKNLADLKLLELLQFKELVDELYGEKVFQKLAEEELEGLFSKKSSIGEHLVEVVNNDSKAKMSKVGVKQEKLTFKGILIGVKNWKTIQNRVWKLFLSSR